MSFDEKQLAEAVQVFQYCRTQTDLHSLERAVQRWQEKMQIKKKQESYPPGKPGCKSNFTKRSIIGTARLNAFKYSKLPIIKILPVTFSYFFYLILNEYSLTLNTIASYQLRRFLKRRLVRGALTSLYAFSFINCA